MKIKGKKIEGRNVEVIIIPRMEEDIVFLAEALPDYDEFDKKVKAPEPAEIIRPGGIREQDTDDPDFKERLKEYATKKTDFTVLVSLQKTEDLEWDTVDMEEPETWNNWRKEMADSGFTDIELMRVVNGVSRANCLSDEMLDEARRNFIRTQEREARELSFRKDEQRTTPSGGPANDSE